MGDYGLLLTLNTVPPYKSASVSVIFPLRHLPPDVASYTGTHHQDNKTPIFLLDWLVCRQVALFSCVGSLVSPQHPLQIIRNADQVVFVLEVGGLHSESEITGYLGGVVRCHIRLGNCCVG